MEEKKICVRQDIKYPIFLEDIAYKIVNLIYLTCSKWLNCTNMLGMYYVVT